MSVFIDVLYADLSRQRVPFDQGDTLSKSDVQAIVVQTDEDNGKLRNIASCMGFDHYALCQKIDNGQQHVMLFGWDDGDYVWRRLTNHRDIDARVSVDAPIGCLHLIFRGLSVDQEKWKEVVRVIDKEML